MVLKSVRRRNGGIEIDWGLQDAIANYDFVLLLEEMIVSSKPVVFSKLAWSLVERIFVAFAVVVIKCVLMFMGAARHASNYW